MIYLFISLFFSAMVSVISLEMVIKSQLRKDKDATIRFHFLLHLLNSIAICIISWFILKSG